MKIKTVLSGLAISALTILTAQSAFAKTGGPFGLGVVLGDPTAITAKYDVDQTNAYDIGLAFNVSKWFLIYGDWQYKFAGAFSRGGAAELSQVTPYVGIGPVLVISNSPDVDTRSYRYFDSGSSSRLALGIRIPLGIEWRPANTPIGVFAEVAPGLTVIPGTYGFVQGGLGIRFFF